MESPATVVVIVANHPRSEVTSIYDNDSNNQERGHSESHRLEDRATREEPAHSSEEIKEVRRKKEEIEEMRRKKETEEVRREEGIGEVQHEEEIEEVRHEEEIEEVRRKEKLKR